MRSNCVTFISDNYCRYYVIPTKKEAEFQAWAASVNGGKQKYDGEDFSDYRYPRPLATLVLTKPYRRFSRRRK